MSSQKHEMTEGKITRWDNCNFTKTRDERKKDHEMGQLWVRKNTKWLKARSRDGTTITWWKHEMTEGKITRWDNYDLAKTRDEWSKYHEMAQLWLGENARKLKERQQMAQLWVGKDTRNVKERLRDASIWVRKNTRPKARSRDGTSITWRKHELSEGKTTRWHNHDLAKTRVERRKDHEMGHLWIRKNTRWPKARSRDGTTIAWRKYEMSEGKIARWDNYELARAREKWRKHHETAQLLLGKNTSKVNGILRDSTTMSEQNTRWVKDSQSRDWNLGRIKLKAIWWNLNRQ
jgi:hypothetical protein